ncbi:MAG: S8 family serine peptidase [Actinomycetota bacterium]|nr:S8 family serine peptidase [Actinomycetota bacterium]
MRVKVMEAGDGRLQGYTFAAALLWAVLLLILAPGSKGEPATRPGVDNDPEGAPYVAGELLVAYEPGTSEEAEETVVRRSGARTLKNLPGEVRLVSFPAIRREASEVARERALARALGHLAHRAGVVAADYNYLREPYFMPDDPRLANQWGLASTKFSGAWNDAKGSGAKVAIVDSGVYSEHPDIGRITAQRDFVEDDAVADDDYGHGTHVTGIAGALTDNGKGVAGGCFGCGLIIGKVMGLGGFTTDSRIVEGIDWSVNQGADVVNLSLGGPADSSVLRGAVNRAHGQGAVVVAAAGNDGADGPRYPAAYSKVIAVGAISADDRLASFSGRGRWVDLAAPGTDIISTSESGGYDTQSGTSMAAPFVSGLAGLLASQGMSAGSIRQEMQATAEDLGPAGQDPRYGHGRIDAANAVR